MTAYSAATTRAQIATGTLYAISNQMATATGTVTLRATFPNDDEALFPNEFVNVKLLVDTLQNAVLVPTPAVQSGAPGDYVYLVNAEQHGVGPQGHAGTERRQEHGHCVGALRGQRGRHRRHGPAERRREDQAVHGAAGCRQRRGRGFGRAAGSAARPARAHTSARARVRRGVTRRRSTRASRR